MLSCKMAARWDMIWVSGNSSKYPEMGLVNFEHDYTFGHVLEGLSKPLSQLQVVVIIPG